MMIGHRSTAPLVATGDSTWRADGDALLEAAAANQQPVELHWRNRHDELHVAKSRIASLEPDEILLEQPFAGDGPLDYAIDDPIDLYLGAGDGLVRFKTYITRVAAAIESSEPAPCAGPAVARPMIALVGQRRRHARVLIQPHSDTPGGRPHIAIGLHTARPDERGVCRLDEQSFTGAMIDLSLGGASLRIDQPPRGSIAAGGMIFVRFLLPGEVFDHVLLTRVRQVRLAHDVAGVCIGVQFLRWPDSGAFAREVSRLERFMERVRRPID